MHVYTHKGKGKRSNEQALSSSLQSYRKLSFVCFVTDGLLSKEYMPRTIQVHHCFPGGAPVYLEQTTRIISFVQHLQ